jgi:hypothetical protein
MTTDNEIPLHIRQAEGLRAVADMIEANPEMAPLLAYSLRNISAPTGSVDDPKAAMATFARATVKHGAKVRKDGSSEWFRVAATWGPVEVEVFGAREQVCERVVTGTETVTKTVPDPEKLAEVPEVEVTETVEIVKWECKPLLASTSDKAA